MNCIELTTWQLSGTLYATALHVDPWSSILLYVYGFSKVFKLLKQDGHARQCHASRRSYSEAKINIAVTVTLPYYYIP